AERNKSQFQRSKLQAPSKSQAPITKRSFSTTPSAIPYGKTYRSGREMRLGGMEIFELACGSAERRPTSAIFPNTHLVGRDSVEPLSLSQLKRFLSGSPHCYRANSSLVAKIFSGLLRNPFMSSALWVMETRRNLPLTLPSPSGRAALPPSVTVC